MCFQDGFVVSQAGLLIAKATPDRNSLRVIYGKYRTGLILTIAEEDHVLSSQKVQLQDPQLPVCLNNWRTKLKCSTKENWVR